MRSLLKKLFVNHWPRKGLSIILAMIIWFSVNQSLTMTKTIAHVRVKIENIPAGKTVDGITSGDILNRHANLTITGRKNLLEDLTSNDIEIVFDASGKEGEWIATITKRNIRAQNPDFNLSEAISKVGEQNFIIKLTKLVTEKIPIIITQPIGEAPKGYQFTDIWPYQLTITISGPENIVKNLKAKGVKLTFNLNDISKTQLDDLSAKATSKRSDVVSFFVPDHWKEVFLPSLSSKTLPINDKDAKYLRIDFVRYELLKLEGPIPVSLYFPPNKSRTLSPQKITLIPNKLVENKGGMKLLTPPLYAKGVSHLFLEMITNMIQLVIIVSDDHKTCLNWSLQFINAPELENRYVRALLSDSTHEELRHLQPQIREEYLRNRFRNYMNRFQLFQSKQKIFDICPTLEGNTVLIHTRKQNQVNKHVRS